jgi:hypothetical protein
LQFARSSAASKLNWLETVLGLFVVVLLTGCAGRTARIIAWADAKYPVTAPQRVALAPHAKPTPAEETLRTHLVAELRRRGFQLAASTNADYTLAFWLEDSWTPGKRVEYYYRGRWTTVYPIAARLPVAVGQWGTVYEQEPAFIRHRVVDFPYDIQAIRLKLFPGVKRPPATDPLTPIWEGYIEGDAKISARRQAQLLRTLLNYFGKEFDGRARLAPSAEAER